MPWFSREEGTYQMMISEPSAAAWAGPGGYVINQAIWYMIPYGIADSDSDSAKILLNLSWD
jgi:hypothetical protein